MTRAFLLSACVILVNAALAAEPTPKFARRPTVKRVGDRVRIEFAVDRRTDVAVFIEDRTGKIVRHLVAGVLGRNAPAPLRPNSLVQSVEWDGKDDDGRPAKGAPFRVRVTAGMKVNWAGTAFSDETGPNQIGGTGVMGMAAGPDGRLYVMSRRGGKVHWRGMWVTHVFRRDGSYEQTVKPPPAHLPGERLKAAGAFRNGRGELAPLLFSPMLMSFYPHVEMSQQMAVTPQGHLLMAVQPVGKLTWDKPKPGVHLAAIDREGGIPFPAYAGPVLDEKQTFTTTYPHLALSSDGKAVYLTGLGTQYYEKRKGYPRGYRVRKAHAVFRVPLPARGPAEVFFGDPDKAGGDETHLSDPRGVAADGKGHLLVADYGNNRVAVIKEADGGWAGSFPVEKPVWVGVHPRTGAVYVESGESVIKFSSWKDAREMARLGGLKSLLYVRGVPPSSGYAKYLRFSFALDASAEPAVLWIGRSSGPRPLMRFEDRGDKFSTPEPAGCYDSPGFWNLSAEPSGRKLVSCRVEPPHLGGNWTKTLYILDEETGEIRRVSPRPSFTHQGCIYRLGPGGRIFSMPVLRSISRHDRDGKFVPYATTKSDVQEKGPSDDGLMENKWTGSSGWTRDFWVARDGDVYVHQRMGGGGNLVKINRLSGTTGRFVKTVVGMASRTAIGPRLDAAGNIYLAECLKPGGVRYPGVFESRLSPKQKDLYTMQYGSVVKFGPQGGAVEWPVKDAETVEKTVLPATLKKEVIPGNWYGNLFRGNPRLDDATVRGAHWVHPNFSKIGRPYCFCLAIDFDVDDFGRTFYPDLLRFRVGVLDTNGNEILHFGAYGNQDCCGPDSYVMDPKGRFFRPRRTRDPKDIKSPFARPEIAFAWIVGIAVTDRYVYVADEVNRRVLRCRLDYAAEEVVAVR